MKLITRNELRTLLLNQTSAAMVAIIGVVPPDLKAKDAQGVRNPYMAGRKLADGFTIGKVNKVGGRIGTDYDREVTSQLTKEIEAQRATNGLDPLSPAELEAEIDRRFRAGTSWHRPIFGANGKPTVLSVNKKTDDDGPAYLRYIVSSEGSPEYLRYEDGGTEPAENITPFRSAPSTYSNQGADDPRIFRTYALENIVEIKIGGERYRISDNFTDRPMAMRNRIWTIAEEYVNGDRNMTKATV